VVCECEEEWSAPPNNGWPTPEFSGFYSIIWIRKEKSGRVPEPLPPAAGQFFAVSFLTAVRTKVDATALVPGGSGNGGGGGLKNGDSFELLHSWLEAPDQAHSTRPEVGSISSKAPSKERREFATVTWTSVTM